MYIDKRANSNLLELELVFFLTWKAIEFELEKLSFVDEMVRGPTGLEKIIKLGWANRAHTHNKTQKQNQS